MSSTKVNNGKRPVLLSILCILTFIFSGSAMLISLAGIFSSEWLLMKAEPMIPGVADYSASFFVILFLSLFIIWVLSLWGAILMFAGRRGGFVLYLIPNGLVFVLQAILTISAFNLGFLVFTLISLLFIVLYATQVRKMKSE